MRKPMKAVLPVSLILLMGFSTSRSGELATGECDVVERALKEANSVKVGMTRWQLEQRFTTEGGLSTPRSRRYVYRDCGYIKLDVKFQPVETTVSTRESPTDKITAISKPYLEKRRLD